MKLKVRRGSINTEHPVSSAGHNKVSDIDSRAELQNKLGQLHKVRRERWTEGASYSELLAYDPKRLVDPSFVTALDELCIQSGNVPLGDILVEVESAAVVAAIIRRTTDELSEPNAIFSQQQREAIAKKVPAMIAQVSAANRPDLAAMVWPRALDVFDAHPNDSVLQMNMAIILDTVSQGEVNTIRQAARQLLHAVDQIERKGLTPPEGIDDVLKKAHRAVRSGHVSSGDELLFARVATSIYNRGLYHKDREKAENSSPDELHKARTMASRYQELQARLGVQEATPEQSVRIVGSDASSVDSSDGGVVGVDKQNGLLHVSPENRKRALLTLSAGALATTTMVHPAAAVDGVNVYAVESTEKGITVKKIDPTPFPSETKPLKVKITEVNEAEKVSEALSDEIINNEQPVAPAKEPAVTTSEQPLDSIEIPPNLPVKEPSEMDKVAEDVTVAQSPGANETKSPLLEQRERAYAILLDAALRVPKHDDETRQVSGYEQAGNVAITALDAMYEARSEELSDLAKKQFWVRSSYARMYLEYREQLAVGSDPTQFLISEEALPQEVKKFILGELGLFGVEDASYTPEQRKNIEDFIASSYASLLTDEELKTLIDTTVVESEEVSDSEPSSAGTSEQPLNNTDKDGKNKEVIGAWELHEEVLDTMQAMGPKWENRARTLRNLTAPAAGYTVMEASGMIGNQCVEAAGPELDPTIEQFGGGPGRGKVQWGSDTVRELDRFGYDFTIDGVFYPGIEHHGTLRWFAHKYHGGADNWDKLDVQDAFTIWELRNTEKKAHELLKESTTLREATDAILNYYERPNERHIGPRLEYAKDIYEMYKKIENDIQKDTKKAEKGSDKKDDEPERSKQDKKPEQAQQQSSERPVLYKDNGEVIDGFVAAEARARRFATESKEYLNEHVCDGLSSEGCDNGCARLSAVIWDHDSAGHYSAATQWRSYVEAKQAHTGDRSVPRGALLFWDSPKHDFGHVAVYLGNGEVVSNVAGGDVKVMPAADIEQVWGQKYLGWAKPNYSTANWQG